MDFAWAVYAYILIESLRLYNRERLDLVMFDVVKRIVAGRCNVVIIDT